MKLPIEEKIVLPSDVAASLSDGILFVKGPKGEVRRLFKHPKIDISVKDGFVRLYCVRGTKREKDVMYSFVAHIENILKGVRMPFVYRLKVCSGHFPMNASLSNEVFEVRNFLGEKSPRKLKIKKGVNVKVSGADIVVESADIELAGCVASDIERLMTKGTRDLRVFQDGIYLVEKP